MRRSNEDKASLSTQEKDLKARAAEMGWTVVDILRGQRTLEHDSVFNIRHAAGALKFFENDPAIPGQESAPIMMRPEVRSVHQHVKGFSALRRGPGRPSARHSRRGLGHAR